MFKGTRAATIGLGTLNLWALRQARSQPEVPEHFRIRIGADLNVKLRTAGRSTAVFKTDSQPDPRRALGTRPAS